MKKNTDNKSKKRKNSENMEGFSEGIIGGIKKLIEKATRGIKNFFLKPINAFKNFIMKPFKTLEDFIRTIICLAVYLELVFKWFSETIGIITQYIVKAPICF